MTELPYAGTSGWSGSDTSRERAEREDSDGTTADRQYVTLAALLSRKDYGLTWKELSVRHGWHHGQASGVLSVLHKTGRVARLTERRDRCAVYVLPEYIGDRQTAPHGRKKNTLTDNEVALLAAFNKAVSIPKSGPDRTYVSFPIGQMRRLMSIVDHLSE